MTERRKIQERQRFMIQELDHRVKNNLAAVMALAEQTMLVTPDLPTFCEAFFGRLRALAPYQRDDAGRIHTSGKNVTLPARASSPICISLHELATNASKYGALSQAGGTVDLTWSEIPEKTLRILWKERGGPPVLPPKKTGLGTILIRGVVEHELPGKVDLSYEPEGIRCEITIPLQQPGSQSFARCPWITQRSW